MHRARTRLFALLCATILLGSCDKKPPFAPDDDPSLSANPGDPLNLTSTADSLALRSGRRRLSLDEGPSSARHAERGDKEVL